MCHCLRNITLSSNAAGERAMIDMMLSSYLWFQAIVQIHCGKSVRLLRP